MLPTVEQAFDQALEFLLANSVIVLATVLIGGIILLASGWLKGGRCYSDVQLHGKTVIITGANTGIGKETARDLSRRGARVILACRNLDKASQAVVELQNDNRGVLVVKKLDLSSFTSIRKFAENVLASEPRIDILINNAGLISTKKKTEDGHELQFQTNHLGHFLLTNLLLDRIKESGSGRIINVSSLAHAFGKMHWDDLNLDKPGVYSPWKAYSQSKLANVLFTKELAKRLEGTGITTYSLHPGAVKTEFGRTMDDVWPAALVFLFKILGPLFSKTSEQGAQTTIYCAVSEDVKEDSGLYYSDCDVKKPSSQALDDDAAKHLWDLSVKMVNL